LRDLVLDIPARRVLHAGVRWGPANRYSNTYVRGSGEAPGPLHLESHQIQGRTIMSKLRSFTGLIVVVCVSWSVSARADVVTDWNAITPQIGACGGPLLTPATPPARTGPPALFDIALVHLAMHDAVQAIEGRYQPYSYSTPGSGSVAAAAVAAAHRALVRLYPPKQTMLDSVYTAHLTSHSISTTDPGLAVGEAAAIDLHSTHYRPLIPIPDFFGNKSP